MAERVKSVAEADEERTTVVLTRAEDDASATARVRSGDADAWLHEGDDGWVLTGDSDVPDGLTSSATTAIRDAALQSNAAQAGTTVEALSRGSAVSTSILVGDVDRAGVAQAVGFALALLFYRRSHLGWPCNSASREKARRMEDHHDGDLGEGLLAGKVMGTSCSPSSRWRYLSEWGLVWLTFTTTNASCPPSGRRGWFTDSSSSAAACRLSAAVAGPSQPHEESIRRKR